MKRLSGLWAVALGTIILFTIQNVVAAGGDSQPQKSEMRVFKVGPFTFGRAVHFDLADTSRPADKKRAALALQKYFKSIGVDLTAPGRSIAWNSRLDLLFVKATLSELDVIEHALVELNEKAPRIHVKTSFIEVPKSGMEVILKAGTMMNPGETNTVGIFITDKMKSVLHELTSVSGTEILAEPEAITISGCQIRIRATIHQADPPYFDLPNNITNLMAISLPPH